VQQQPTKKGGSAPGSGNTHAWRPDFSHSRHILKQWFRFARFPRDFPGYVSQQQNTSQSVWAFLHSRSSDDVGRKKNVTEP
jgi:hypothetical protein